MKGGSLSVLSSRAVVFRNTPFGVDAWSAVGEVARYEGRFHRKGEPLPQYAANSQLATIRELELHSQEPLEPSREILRRITAIALAAGSQVLIADHAETLAAAEVTLEQVYDFANYGACHALMDYARSQGVVAVETQSNADRGQRTIAILPEKARLVTGLVDYWEGSLNLLRRAFPNERPPL